MASEKLTDIGPLPKVSRTHDLQALSLQALGAALPSDRFIIRDERIEDYGVDCSLEAKIPPSRELKVSSAIAGEKGPTITALATNIRAQAQVKGTESLEPNKAGEFVALPVETGNFNYLMNGPCPIYILYRHDVPELRYVWARDELRRIEDSNADWRSQESITLRFSRILDHDAAVEIHGRILREGRFSRKLWDLLVQFSLLESVNFTVDRTSLELEDLREIERRLRDSGFTLVGAGYAAEVIELGDRLTEASRKQARLRLVLAYASYSLGKYPIADAMLREVQLQRDDLSEADASFLDILSNAMAMHIGRIDHDEYLRREEGLISGGHPLLRAQHRLRVIRVSVLRQWEVCARSQMLDEVRGIVNEIESSDASRHFKVKAQLLLLELEGHENIRRFQDFAIKLSTRDTSGRPVPRSEIELATEQWQQAAQRWRSTASTILLSALKDLHPLVLADAFALRAKVEAATLENQYLLGQIEQFEFGPEPPAFHGPMRDAELAIAFYRSLGALEGELRATMTLCDLFALQGQSEPAREMARTVAPKAEAMLYAGILDHATRHIEDRWEVLECARRYAEFRSSDDDFSFAEQSDDDIRSFARFCLEQHDLPVDRLGVVESECFSLRASAQVHVNWCRHLELIQDLRHTFDAATMYAEVPDQWCHCTKLGLNSKARGKDGVQLLEQFKIDHCVGCDYREPKHQEARGAESSATALRTPEELVDE